MSDDATQEVFSLSIDGEGLNLENDLDETMKDRENEVDGRDLGDGDSVPLFRMSISIARH